MHVGTRAKVGGRLGAHPVAHEAELSVNPGEIPPEWHGSDTVYMDGLEPGMTIETLQRTGEIEEDAEGNWTERFTAYLSGEIAGKPFWDEQDEMYFVDVVIAEADFKPNADFKPTNEDGAIDETNELRKVLCLGILGLTPAPMRSEGGEVRAVWNPVFYTRESK